MRAGPRALRGAAAAATLAAAVRTIAAPEPAEMDALLALWRAHMASPTGHAAIVGIATTFLRRFPHGELRAVAQGLAAWHALREAATNQAAALWSEMLQADATPLDRAGQTIARRWLTRLDREAVRAALRRHYAQHVAFPPTLQPLRALPPDQRPPLTDRFGEAWQYSLDGFRRIPGTRGHRYRLFSSRLGEELSDLSTALARPYGGGHEPPRPLRRLGAAVQFELGSEQPVVGENTTIGPWRLARVTERFLVLSDDDYWWLLPAPPEAPAAPQSPR
ncbi:MAG: hypothetical protein N2652_02505 [Kiritimatiellae bacterium]|nr:hypothetical protein [Kiritimatiellia bacterium]